MTTMSKLAPPADEDTGVGLVSVHRKANFRALRTEYAVTDGGVAIPLEAARMLKAELGEKVALTPLPPEEPPTKSGRKGAGISTRHTAPAPPEASLFFDEEDPFRDYLL